MIKKAIALGLVGILAGNMQSYAQNLETENPKIEIQQQNKSSLDSLVEIYNTPAAIQRFTAQNIKYVEESEQFYPEAYKNQAPEGFKRYPSPEQILNKKNGNCREGFILTAAALKKLGYETMGLAINPKNGELGHIFTIYKDTLTDLYGTAGISVEDYISPVYNSIDDLIAGMALKSKYHDFRITAVKVNDNILSNSDYIDLPKEYVKDMNLTDIFGVLFKKENCKFGELKKDIYDDGYKIALDNTIIEPKNSFGDIKGPINRSYMFYKNDAISLNLNYKNDHRNSGNMNLRFNKKGEPYSLYLSKSDASKLRGTLSYYFFNQKKNVFEPGTVSDSKKNLSQKESQEYIDIANYFLKLLKNDETKALWEQTKRERAIKKAQQDSLPNQNSLQLPNKD